MQRAAAFGLALLAGLVLAAGAAAHGDEDDLANLAKQPAKVLVQQAHALLVNGRDPMEAAERLDAAELSKDKSGIDPALLERGHEALERGELEKAIGLLEQALAAPVLEKAKPKATEEMPAEAAEPAGHEEAPAAGAGQGESGKTAGGHETLLESEEAQKAIHGQASIFHPGHGGQEIAAGIAGGILLAAAMAGLAWRRRREQPRSRALLEPDARYFRITEATWRRS